MTITAQAPRVLIIGATGSLGSELVRNFQNPQQGPAWQVVGTHRSSKDGERLGSSGAVPLKLDVSDAGQVRDLAEALKKAGVDKLDAVVMNAGVLKARSRDGFFRVNADGPEAVTRALAESGLMPKNFVMISSQLVGGADASKQKPEHRYMPGGMGLLSKRSHYAESKAAGEGRALLNYQMAHMKYWLAEDKAHPENGKMLFRSSSDEAAQGFVALRPAGILGPDDTVTTVPMIQGLKGFLGWAGLYPNNSTGDDPKISVISARDTAHAVKLVADQNHAAVQKGEAPLFFIGDIENGENGLRIPDIVDAGRGVFGTAKIFSPHWSWFYGAYAFVQELKQTRLNVAVHDALGKAKSTKIGSWTPLAKAIDWVRDNIDPAIVVDKSRVPELGHPELSTSNERLIAAFPAVANINFKSLEGILREVAIGKGSLELNAKELKRIRERVELEVALKFPFLSEIASNDKTLVVRYRRGILTEAQRESVARYFERLSLPVEFEEAEEKKAAA